MSDDEKEAELRKPWVDVDPENQELDPDRLREDRDERRRLIKEDLEA